MIPVIDLFAGPGGLGEGFSAFRDKLGQRVFRIALSIEKDESAHTTLLVRSFFRQFADTKVPEEYYRFVRNEISLDSLFNAYPAEAARARKEAWKAELGKVSETEVDRRIREALDGAKNWILIGGPPCQAYSVIGRARIMGESRRRFGDSLKKYEEDDRHFLYKEYLRILRKHTPPIFVMENVKGLLSTRVGGNLIIQNILKDLENLDYKLYSFVDYRKQEILSDSTADEQDPADFVIRCEKHGIPQCRHRLIIMGVHRSIRRTPRVLRNREKSVSLWKVIGDLPKLRSQLSREKDSPEAWAAAIQKLVDEVDSVENRNVREAIRRAAKSLGKDNSTGSGFVPAAVKPAYRPDWFHDPRLGGVLNHETRSHMASDLRRYFFAACFAKVMKRPPVLVDFPKSLLPAHENIKGGVNEDTYFRDRFRVQLKSKPSTTITSHIAKDGHYFIHPDPSQCRSLTVREAARLQTFPDNYVFLGGRTKQYQQVGNAVPPLLARQLAAVVYELLRVSVSRKSRQMDRLTKEKRSWNMSRIRSKNTGPERVVRSCLRRLGIRFKSYGKGITGRPDIILPGRKTALFIHGCFWHRHPRCPFAYTPKSRVAFWRRKFERNVARDRLVRRQLRDEGWTVIVVWECETADRDSLKSRLQTLLARRH